MEIKSKNQLGISWASELEKKLKWLLLFRLIIFVVIFIAIFFLFPQYSNLFRLMIFYGVVSLGYLGSLYFWKITRRKPGFEFIYAIQLISEIGLEAAIVHYSGGLGSLLTILFALTIFSAAFIYRLAGTVIIATIAVAAYITIVYLELRGIIHPIRTPTSNLLYSNMDMAYAAGYIQICFLYIIAFVSGYMSQKIGTHLGELEEARKKLERIKLDTDQILQCMRSGLITVDHEGKIIYFNEAASRILQLPGESVMGTSPAESFPKRLASLSEYIKKALSSTAFGNREEMTIESEYGQPIPILLVASSLRVEGKPSGVIVVFEDVTEEKKKELLLREMEKLASLGSLSARLAHELRNPISVIRGSAEMLEKEVKSGNTSQRLTNLIMRESDRLTSILEEFLAFARLKEASQEPARMELINVRKLVDESWEIVRMGLEHPEDIAFENSIPSDLKVLGRKEQLLRMFINFLQNSVEAMGEIGGKISVSMGRVVRSPYGKDELLTGISIRDTGEGIKTEDLQKIFEPFFTTKVKGVGLGLAIVQGIVNQHGGFIEVKSEWGYGTEFIVYLPCERE